MDLNSKGNKLTKLDKEVISLLSKSTDVKELASVTKLVAASIHAQMSSSVDGDDVNVVNLGAALRGIPSQLIDGTQLRNIDEILTSETISNYASYLSKMDGDYVICDMPQNADFSIRSEEQFGPLVFSAVLHYYLTHPKSFVKRPKDIKVELPLEYDIWNLCFTDKDYSQGTLIVKRVTISQVSGYITGSSETICIEEILSKEKVLEQDLNMENDSYDQSEDFEVDDFDDYER